MDIVIGKLELRTTLGDDEKAALRRCFSTTRSFEPGQNLLTEGEAPSFVGALLQGSICRQKSLAGGERQILSLPLPGDIFDLHSFLLDRMDHSVTALTQCRVATASHVAIEALAHAYPRLGALLWRDAVVEGSIFREWIVNTGRRSAFGRIAHLFCELMVRNRDVGLASELSYAMPLTQAGLAEVTGLSVVHVNRVLQQLRAQRLIALEKHRLTILDWNGLVAAGGFEPSYLHAGPRVERRLASPMANGLADAEQARP